MDELETLALYLYQVDLADRLSGNPDVVLFHPPSQPMLDAWYDGQRGAGVVVPKPRVLTTARMRRFIDELQRRRPNGWLASVTAAAQVPYLVAEYLDHTQADLAAEATDRGLVVHGDAEHRIMAIAHDLKWDDPRVVATVAAADL